MFERLKKMFRRTESTQWQPRWTARCAMPMCDRYTWGVSEDILKEHAAQSGWVQIDGVWLCRQHRFMAGGIK